MDKMTKFLLCADLILMVLFAGSFTVILVGGN